MSYECQVPLASEGRKEVVLGPGFLLVMMIPVALLIALAFLHEWSKRADPIGSLRPERLEHLRWIPRSKTHGIDLADAWFEIVAHVANPDDLLVSHLHNKPWLREFIPLPGNQADTAWQARGTARAVGTGQAYDQEFATARTEFKSNPEDFVLCLEKVSKELRTRELSESVLMYCAAPEAVDIPGRRQSWLARQIRGMHKPPSPREIEKMRRQRLKCWLDLQSQILEVIAGSNTSNYNAGFTAANRKCGPALDLLQDQRTVDSMGFKQAALSQSRDFLGRHLSMYDEPEDAIARSWKLERRRRFAEISKGYSRQSSATFKGISEWLKRCMESQPPLSAVYHQFQLKIIDFVEILAGRAPSTFEDALQGLRDIASRDNRQQKILYDEIERLRSDVDKKQQIITCLGYRHVLEKLPKKDSMAFTGHGEYPRPPKKLSATVAWHITWDLAVEDQLKELIRDFNATTGRVPATTVTTSTATSGASTATAIQSNTPATTSTATIPAASSADAKSDPIPALVRALKNDFDFHAQDWATKAGINRQPLQIKDMKYKTWPIYTRGKLLYSALSGNIHSYGESFEIRKTNWLKVEFDILDWLRPTEDAPSSNDDPLAEDAFWADQWTKRKLPA